MQIGMAVDRNPGVVKGRWRGVEGGELLSQCTRDRFGVRRARAGEGDGRRASGADGAGVTGKKFKVMLFIATTEIDIPSPTVIISVSGCRPIWAIDRVGEQIGINRWRLTKTD